VGCIFLLSCGEIGGSQEQISRFLDVG
jgi:hypothetical protein